MFKSEPCRCSTRVFVSQRFESSSNRSATATIAAKPESLPGSELNSAFQGQYSWAIATRIDRRSNEPGWKNAGWVLAKRRRTSPLMRGMWVLLTQVAISLYPLAQRGSLGSSRSSILCDSIPMSWRSVANRRTAHSLLVNPSITVDGAPHPGGGVHRHTRSTKLHKCGKP